jgi:hypothetical protein
MGILARRFTNISPPTRCGRTSANLYAFDLQAVVGKDLGAVVIAAIRDSFERVNAEDSLRLFADVRQLAPSRCWCARHRHFE